MEKEKGQGKEENNKLDLIGIARSSWYWYITWAKLKSGCSNLAEVPHPRGADPGALPNRQGVQVAALGPLVGSRGRAPVGVLGAKPPENMRF